MASTDQKEMLRAKVMAADLKLSIALPCRISEYTEFGKTLIGIIEPTAILSSLPQDASLAVVENEVEAKSSSTIP